MTTAILGVWHYESDGEGHDITHYATRDDATQPCGVARIDFRNAKAAKEFVKNSNALIFRVLNRRKALQEVASS